METTFITAGVVCLVAAIVGGGLKALGFEMPLVSSIGRQISLGATGMAFITVGLVLDKQSDGSPREANPGTLTQRSANSPEKISGGDSSHGKSKLPVPTAAAVKASEAAAAKTGKVEPVEQPFSVSHNEGVKYLTFPASDGIASLEGRVRATNVNPSPTLHVSYRWGVVDSTGNLTASDAARITLLPGSASRIEGVKRQIIASATGNTLRIALGITECWEDHNTGKRVVGRDFSTCVFEGTVRLAP